MWSLLSKLRFALAGHRWVARGVVLVAASATGWVVHDALERVDAARAAWGTTSSVLVADGTIEPAEVVGDRIGRRDVPTAIVPDGAVSEIPPGAVARRRLNRGEILVGADVAPVGAGVADQLRPDEGAVTIVERVPSGAAVDDVVRVVGDGVVLARSGRVLRRAETTVQVALPVDDAVVVAGASASGVELALVTLP